jgi:hypothetical protein
VVSGQWSVVSGQWSVVVGHKNHINQTNHSSDLISHKNHINQKNHSSDLLFGAKMGRVTVKVVPSPRLLAT